MSEIEESFKRSIELAKSGFENAQARITAIDTKVGVAVGFLVVLLPAPLIVASWLTGLQETTANYILRSCSNCGFASTLTASFLILGMMCAFIAILRGFYSLTPRGPKGYVSCGPFENDWQPNVLFPIHKPGQVKVFCNHLHKLQSGVDMSFVVNEYDHQLQQLGRILDEKFEEMRNCFWWLSRCLFCYGIAVLSVAGIALAAIVRSAGP